jgi:hypothetical protein
LNTSSHDTQLCCAPESWTGIAMSSAAKQIDSGDLNEILSVYYGL